MTRTSILGGEATHRSRLGGTVAPWRLAALGASVAAFVVLVWTAQLPGAIIGVLLTTATYVLTMPTARGSVAERWVARRRWREREKLGLLRYTPFDQEEWDRLLVVARSGPKPERPGALRDLAAMREVPDGADGMGWLEKSRRKPGIAWHAPEGEESYLSVAFEVSGQIRGLQNGSRVAQAAERWGRLQADLASHDSLVSGIQTLTRVLPPDSARHQRWIFERLDPNVPREIAASYDELIRTSDSSSMIGRHFVVVGWPLSTAFSRAASRLAAGREGWKALMAREIPAIRRSLLGAGHEWVRPLSATQTAAFIHHLQDPSRPLDHVAGVDPDVLGLPSAEEDYSAYVVPYTDPRTGETGQWWHRTGAIRAEDMATLERHSMWLTRLVGGGHHVLRTVSFQLRIVPADEALQRARLDRTRDQADRISRSKAGRTRDDAGDVRLKGAERRAADLVPGKQHAGVEWIGFITLTARSREELALACADIKAIASRESGISRISWLDTYQSPAQGTTWPIFRGLQPPSRSGGSRFTAALTGHGAKEEL